MIGEQKQRAARTAQAAGFAIRTCPPDRKSIRSMVPVTRPTWLLVQDLPDEDTGLMLLGEARRADPNLRIAMLGAPHDLARCVRWIRQGVSCYLASTTTSDRLFNAMSFASRSGVLVVDDCFQQAMLTLTSRLQPEPPLSSRELDVLKLIGRGLRNCEIAKELHLADHTIEFHAKNIIAKMGARSRANAVARGILLGLITPGALAVE